MAILGRELISWLAERGQTRIALIESPIGNTVPTQFLEALAKKRGLAAEIVQWNAPRNDNKRRGRTVEDAAAICAAETAEFDLVVLADESLTGSRFLKLFQALIGPIGRDRFLSIAMLFPDSRRPELANNQNRARLKALFEPHGRHISYPNCFVTFSGHRRFRIDGGPFAVWESPVIWGDSDLIAGKRKINLAFMLIDHFRDIIDDLAQTESVYRPYLETAWALDDHGKAFAFVPGLMQCCFEDIGRDLPLCDFRNALWTNGKSRFPQDYRGDLEAMSDIGVRERYDWLRTAFVEEATRRIGEQRAGMLYHAIDTVFSASFPAHVPRAGRDLDATAYTIDFNPTIRSFNSWLIRRLLDRVDELDQLNP